MSTNTKQKIVLAYSGGLDTTIIIPWLKENYDCEVIAVCIDVGQGDELSPLRQKAIQSGASKIYIEDVTDEFLTDFVFPTLQAGAIYEGKYLLGTSFARPVIAKKLVEIARKEGATTICHGATGKGNDQVRFELTIKALAPEFDIIAPWRIWDIRSREQAIEYATQRGLPIPVTKKRPYSMDRNIWHLSHEGGDLENPWNQPKDDLLLICNTIDRTPDLADYVEIGFVQGVPTTLDGRKQSPRQLMTMLNDMGARHGIGVVDMVENRLVGMKSRGVYETPGGEILYTAHQCLEQLCLDRATAHCKEMLAIRFAELVYDGCWFTPLREAISAFVTSTQQTVTGKVRLRLFKGRATPAGMTSPYSLFDAEIATFEADQVFDQRDAQGFINLFGLPLKVRAQMQARIQNINPGDLK